MITILQSLIVYTATALMLYGLGRVAERREDYYLNRGRQISFWAWEIVASLLIFAFISGVRWNVGVDYQYYREEFLYAQDFGYTTKDFEIGFKSFTELIAALGIHYSFYFAILAFLQLFFVYQTFKNDRYLLPYVGLTVVLGFHYLSWMNGIRQMLAATIFLYSIQFIKNKKIALYVSFILLASLIHKSALILLVLYFLPSKDIFSSRILTIALSILFLYIGMDPGWIASIEKYMSIVLVWVGYESYSENIGLLIEQSGEKNFGPRMIATYSLFILVVFYSPELKKKFYKFNFMIYYNIYVIGYLANFIFLNSHHIFLRPVSYLTIVSIPVVSILLFHLFKLGKKSLIQFFLVLSLAISYTPLSTISEQGKGIEDYANYRFIWFHD